MDKPAFLILVGFVLLALALWEISRTIRTGSVKLRGGALITRGRSPRIYWFNIGFQTVVACGGAALALWGLFHERLQ
jgi:hypothetical protein